MIEPRDVLIIGEHRHGDPRLVALETITAGRRIADALGGELVILVPGHGVGKIANVFSRVSGVDRVITVEDPGLSPFTPGPWSAAISSIAKRHRPAVIMIPGSITGRDYAARVAARLDAGLVPDVTNLWTEEGQLVAQRAVLGGRVQTAIRFSGSGGPSMVTIAPGAFPRAVVGGGSCTIESAKSAISVQDMLVSVVEVSAHDGDGQALAGAERIVSGGRGLGKAENFALVEELAKVLDAAVGASGAVVGAGWRSHADQVGSTGYTVAPRLYLAVGISGAPQHLVGMQGSDYIVAINRDPDAPIFKVASFGIVGDLFEVVPALIARLRKTSA